jgi:hypothetical protein
VDWSVAKDVLTAGAAIYGAALSSLNWWNARKKDRRAVLVTMDTAMPTYPDGSLGPPFARIQVVNTGHRVIRVESLSIEIPGSNRRIVPTAFNNFVGMPDTPLPVSLEDGETAHLMMSYDDVANGLEHAGLDGEIGLVPLCRDSVGGSYRGEPWKVSALELRRVVERATR